jgi:DNA-directed RNA polymerase specialized sigma24 family protein
MIMKPNPSSLSDGAQVRFQVLEKILDQIGDKQSRLILMHSRGYRPQDIARELNISEPKVYRQLHAAKRDVKNLLKKYYR